jgi:hypothetical protein
MTKTAESTLRGKKALIVLGVGLGYQVEALKARKDPHARIYTIELHEEVYSRAVTQQNWDSQEDSDVEFWVGEDIDSVLTHLDQVTKGMDDDEWEIVTNRPSIRLAPEYYKRVIRERRPAHAGR